jgi:N-acyl-D-aspartate/D-glutamate deacylase
LVIRGAEIYDGSGEPAFVGDLAVDDDRISRVRSVREGGLGERGGVEVQAAGLCLAPGFIDVHSHDDFAALLEPELPFKLLQGVTTEVVGNCGMGAAPFAPAREVLRVFHPGRELPAWQGFAGFFERLDAEPPSANLAVLAGHGTMRGAILPGASRAADAGERLALRRLLAEALDAGVVGLSSGLIYEPGRHADRTELLELAVDLQRERGVYTTHLRSEADGLLEAVDEAIELCEGSGVGLQLSHHKAYGRRNWGSVEASLARVDAARARGLDVWLDQYPYTAGSTLLASVMSRGAITDVDESPCELRAEDVVIATVLGRPELEGKTIAELAAQWGTAPSAAAERVLSLDADCWVIVHAMCEADVRRVLEHPATMIGSDGIPNERGRPHPRLFGTFPRVLGHYARREGQLSLTEAIHKMTTLPARRFGLEGRGRIVAGSFADLVLFDAHTILDRATFEEPRLAPDGIKSVWVNGRHVVRDANHLGTRPGRVLRRAGQGRA